MQKRKSGGAWDFQRSATAIAEYGPRPSPQQPTEA